MQALDSPSLRNRSGNDSRMRSLDQAGNFGVFGRDRVGDLRGSQGTTLRILRRNVSDSLIWFFSTGRPFKESSRSKGPGGEVSKWHHYSGRVAQPSGKLE